MFKTKGNEIVTSGIGRAEEIDKNLSKFKKSKKQKFENLRYIRARTKLMFLTPSV